MRPYPIRNDARGLFGFDLVRFIETHKSSGCYFKKKGMGCGSKSKRLITLSVRVIMQLAWRALLTAIDLLNLLLRTRLFDHWGKDLAYFPLRGRLPYRLVEF